MELQISIPRKGLGWQSVIAFAVVISLAVAIVHAFKPPVLTSVPPGHAELAARHHPVVAEPAPIVDSPPAAPANAAAVVTAAPVVDPARGWFNGRPVRAVRTMPMRVTAYSPDERSCAPFADGLTASGYSVWTNGGRLVAADSSVLPLGSLISVPGYDGASVVPVLDRGGRIRGNRLDVLYATHDQAVRWGVQDLTITVWEYADGLPSDFRSQW